jgi:hypothetical protein
MQSGLPTFLPYLLPSPPTLQTSVEQQPTVLTEVKGRSNFISAWQPGRSRKPSLDRHCRDVRVMGGMEGPVRYHSMPCGWPTSSQLNSRIGVFPANLDTVEPNVKKLNPKYMQFDPNSTYHHQRVNNRIPVDDFSQTQLFLMKYKIRIEQFQIFEKNSI